MKHRVALLILALAISLPCFSCVKQDEKKPGKRLVVVATLFPLYDFAKNVAGERADVTLLLPPGAEPHSFEPKPADIMRLNKADVFLYTSPDMEPWASDILKGLQNRDLEVVNTSLGVWRLMAVALLLSLTLGAAAGAIAARQDQNATVVTASTLATPPTTERVGHVLSVPDVVVATGPSIVVVSVTVEADPSTGSLLADANGTGFVIRSDGMIATAAHVIAGALSLSVTLASGDTLPARIQGVDEATDLAVLSIDRNDLVPLDFGRTSAVRVGEPVVAFGHALDLGVEPTVSVGVLSAVERTITSSDGRTYDHLLQTDAAINSGDSGGPLVNRSGQVIGINTAKISSDDAEGIGFAICTDHALPVLVRLEGP